MSDSQPIRVTSLIKKWFNIFDEDEIIYKMLCSEKCDDDSKEQITKKWKKKRDNGTLLHAKIEEYLLNHGKIPLLNKDIDIEFQYFLNFMKKHSDLEMYETEKHIFSKDKKVQGTLDCLMKDKEGKFYLIDWKCCGEIKLWSFEKGFGPFDKLNDYNYNHYMLQLNIYRHILETNYDIKIHRLWLINFHRNNKNYYRYSIPRYNIEEIWNDLVF